MSSAVALHKMHTAVGFGLPATFNIVKTADITDGRNVRNSGRPTELLNNTEGRAFGPISRRSAKTHKPEDVAFVAEKIGNLTDEIMLPLFDKLRPYSSHNHALRQLLETLNDSSALADPVQAKCRSLLFDGTGNRNVFEEHILRLKENVSELKAQDKPVPSHLTQQLSYCDSVSRALQAREDSVKARRSFMLFNIDETQFLNRDKTLVDSELRELRARGKSIFDALSTQAFQLGYLMAVISHVEILLPPAASYDERMAFTKFLSNFYLAGLNAFFEVPTVRHRTLSGFVQEARAQSFDAAHPGFRGLLAATNVRELNEKQWVFFRYMVLEIVHSRMASDAVLAVLALPANSEMGQRFKSYLPTVLSNIMQMRKKYFESAVQAALQDAEFKREVERLEMQAEASGKGPDDIRAIIEAAFGKKRADTESLCEAHLKASLGRLESMSQILHRFGSVEDMQAEPGSEGSVEESKADASGLETVVAMDRLKHPSDEGTNT